jgi:hypothetical protein
MLVEVADSSLERDRGKAAIYARAGVPRYWIVNLTERWVEVYGAPSGEAPTPCYHQRRDYAAGAQVPVVIDEVTIGAIDAGDLLPR